MCDFYCGKPKKAKSVPEGEIKREREKEKPKLRGQQAV